MKILRIILFIVLTLSLIFFALQLDLATFIVGGFLDKSLQQFLMIQLILQFGGFFCYWKLFKKMQNKLDLSPKRELSFWVIAFITLMVLPGGFILQQDLSYKAFKRDQAKYDKEHCVEKITKVHSYKVRICENGTIVADTSEAASEYLSENK